MLHRRTAPTLPRWAWQLGLAVVALVAAAPAPARAARLRTAQVLGDARSLLFEYSTTASVFVAAGQSDFSGWRASHPASPMGIGFRYHERNGFITGTTMGIFRMLAGAMAASGPKSVRSYDEGNYRVTETTYYSAAEKQAIQQAAANSAAQMFASPHQSFDLELYSRNMGSDAEGYRTNWMIGGGSFMRGRMLIDVGFGFGRITAATAGEGKYLIAKWGYVGMPFRASYALGPVLLSGQWDWNWLGHSRKGKLATVEDGAKTTALVTAGFPLRASAAMALFGRLYLEAQVMTPSFSSGKVGYSACAGARF